MRTIQLKPLSADRSGFATARASVLIAVMLGSSALIPCTANAESTPAAPPPVTATPAPSEPTAPPPVTIAATDNERPHEQSPHRASVAGYAAGTGGRSRPHSATMLYVLGGLVIGASAVTIALTYAYISIRGGSGTLTFSTNEGTAMLLGGIGAAVGGLTMLAGLLIARHAERHYSTAPWSPRPTRAWALALPTSTGAYVQMGVTF